MSRKANPGLIGTFVVAAMVLALGAVAVFGSGHLFREAITFSVFFDKDVAGLGPGAPVRFKGVEVGSVREVLIDLPGAQRREGFRIPVIFDIDLDKLRARGAAAYISNPAVVDTLVALGLRATLETESLVTGRKYIGLDMYPGTPIELENEPGNPYRELPTTETGLETIQRDLQNLIDKIADVGVEHMVESVTRLADGLERTLNSEGLRAGLDSLPGSIGRLNATLADLASLAVEMDSSMAPLREHVGDFTAHADTTMYQLDSLLAAARATVEPGSPVSVRLEEALAEMAATMRALRELAEYLDRNPSSIVRGKPEDNR